MLDDFDEPIQPPDREMEKSKVVQQPKPQKFFTAEDFGGFDDEEESEGIKW